MRRLAARRAVSCTPAAKGVAIVLPAERAIARRKHDWRRWLRLLDEFVEEQQRRTLNIGNNRVGVNMHNIFAFGTAKHCLRGNHLLPLEVDIGTGRSSAEEREGCAVSDGPIRIVHDAVEKVGLADGGGKDA